MWEPVVIPLAIIITIEGLIFAYMVITGRKIVCQERLNLCEFLKISWTAAMRTSKAGFSRNFWRLTLIVGIFHAVPAIKLVINWIRVSKSGKYGKRLLWSSSLTNLITGLSLIGDDIRNIILILFNQRFSSRWGNTICATSIPSVLIQISSLECISWISTISGQNCCTSCWEDYFSWNSFSTSG